MKQLYLVAFLLPFMCFAQTRSITGTVTDENKQPLPGATVQIQGVQGIGSITDFDGNFTIQLTNNEQNTLLISYLGYLEETVDVSSTNTVSVSLAPDVTKLEEVIVVGYGTVLRKDLTGAVSSVKVEDNVARQSMSVDQLLEGRAAGVQVTGNLSNPNSGFSVKIRGTNSLRGNNEPLYVVDGIIMSSAGEDAALNLGGNDLQSNQNGLNGINPRDIERIEVLKDASATAIYGSRGANGVIIITTKQGEKGKVTINAFNQTSISNISKKLNPLDGIGFANYRNEIDFNASEISGNPYQPAYQIDNSSGLIYRINYNETTGDAVVASSPYEEYSWQDEIYRTGISNSSGISARGGSDLGNFYFSMGLLDHKPIVNGSSYKTGDFRLNLKRDLSKRLSLQLNFSAFTGKGDFAQDADRAAGSRSFYRTGVVYRPLVSDNVELDIDDEAYINSPISFLEDFSDLTEETRYFGNLRLNYDIPIKGLSYSLRVGGNQRTKIRNRFYGPTTYIGQRAINGNGQLTMSELNSFGFQINNLLNYNRTFNRIHRINAVAGITYDERKSDNSVYRVEDFSTFEFGADQPFYGQSVTYPLEIRQTETQLFSYLARVNYTLKNRYVFTASFRADGSSKFRNDNKYGYFPSAAFAWRANNEPFIKNTNLFNELKFRVGWGQTGNQAIRPYQTLANYGPELVAGPGNTTSIGFVPLNIGNSDLKWEFTEQVNAGLDFDFNFLPISGSFDIYNKTTEDLLQLSPLPPSAGFDSLFINRGGLENKGVELALLANIVDTPDFKFSIGGNIAFNRTKITNLGIPNSDLFIDGSMQQRSFYLGNTISTGVYFKYPANIFVEGEESALFYGFETDGIYQEGDDFPIAGNQPGDLKIIDQNGDGNIDDSDRTIIGNPNPDFTFGGTLNLSFKNWSLSALFSGVQGNDVINGWAADVGGVEGTFINIFEKGYTNAWRSDAPSNSYPRLGYSNRTPINTNDANITNDPSVAMPDTFIEDGSFVRLKNITLGYDLPVKDFSSIFSRFNVYISAQNLFTWTDYSGYDPEISSFLYDGTRTGIDWYGPPNVRMFTLGLNIDF